MITDFSSRTSPSRKLRKLISDSVTYREASTEVMSFPLMYFDVEIFFVCVISPKRFLRMITGSSRRASQVLSLLEKPQTAVMPFLMYLDVEMNLGFIFILLSVFFLS